MIPATPRHRQLKNNLAGIYGGMGGNPDKTIATPVCNSELWSIGFGSCAAWPILDNQNL